MNRSIIIARNILLRIRHDRRTLVMIVMMPLLFMFLFGYTFAGEPENVKVIVVNDDAGVLMSKDERFDDNTLSIERSENLEDAEKKVEHGRAWAVIYFPKNFSMHMLNKELNLKNEGLNLTTDDAVIIIEVDRSSPQVSSAIIKAISGALSDYMSKYNPEVAFSEMIRQEYVYGASAEFIDFFAIGIIGLVVTIITIILTIISVVRERSQGTLDRLFVSPVKPYEISVGYTLAFTFIAAVQAVELILIATLGFNITFEGSVLLALFLIILYAIGMQGLGILFSTAAKSEFQAVQFVPLVILPSIILAGVFWPIEAMPLLIRPLSLFIPLTYLNNALRSVMIRGWGLAEIWTDILALLIFAVVMFLISVNVMHRRAYRKS